MPVCILDFRWASSKWNLGFEKKKKKYSLFNTFLCDEETKFCVVTLSSFFVVVQSLSRVWLFVTPWTALCQAPLIPLCPNVFIFFHAKVYHRILNTVAYTIW